MSACLAYFALTMIGAASARGQSFERQMEAEAEKLVAKHGTGTDRKLGRRFIATAKLDQSVRAPEYVSGQATANLVKKQEHTDAQLTGELKRIVARHGWPTIRLAGLEASGDAALILTHSPDRSFQRRMLPRLQQLAQDGEIVGSSIGAIVDKLLIADGKPQRFGTQFKWPNGNAEMLPVEDEAGLEERRAKNLLPPMVEYKRMLAELYKVNVR